MIITNHFNLPTAVYNLISKDNYKRGDNNYSVTELIESPQVVQLKRRYWEILTEDAIDRIWSVFGSAVHNVMEAHASDEAFVEERYYIERLGRTIGGMVDCYDSFCISDYKVTSAWSIVYGSRTEHWSQQLNMYAHILRENGHTVNNLQVVAFLRDWDRNKAKADYTYPQVPLLVMPIEVWSPERCEEYILERLSLHIANEDCADEALTECDASECWAKPDKYAVMKEGSNKATRVLDTQEEAESYMEGCKGTYEVVKRPGGRTRCSDYCSMSKICHQYKSYCGEL